MLGKPFGFHFGVLFFLPRREWVDRRGSGSVREQGG
jgi:hypothetical protein